MGDLTPALVAIASIVTGLVALSRNLPRVRRLFGVDRSELIAEIREKAELWEDRAGIVTADLVAERAAHAETRATLLDEQRAGARCRRELGDAQSELRAIARRRPGTAR